MKLRTRYVAFVVILHIIFFVLSLQLLDKQRWWFLLTEIMLIVSIGFSISLYRSLIRPVNMIMGGIETIKDKDFSTKLVPVNQHEMDQLIDVYNRMIDQLRSERIRQREQHFFLERLLQAAPVGIIILDFDGLITELNPTATRILDLEIDQCIGFALGDLSGDLISGLNQLAPGDSSIIAISGMQAYKCRKSQFRDQGFYHHFIIIEELTDELYKTEKQAYGKIIRLMSHEINNSIGAVNSILDSFLAYGTHLPEADRGDFENTIDIAITRNRHLTQFRTNYAEVVRLPAPEPIKQDLHQLLQTVEILLHSQCVDRGIEWVWELSESPFNIIVDDHQFEHVLVNIIKNAMEAIGEKGTITIITQRQPKAKLIIRDSGSGFSAEIKKQLFSPFFSTKKNGQGIGLTLVREILMNHGFRFSLERIAAEYTEFEIIFD